MALPIIPLLFGAGLLMMAGGKKRSRGGRPPVFTPGQIFDLSPEEEDLPLYRGFPENIFDGLPPQTVAVILMVSEGGQSWLDSRRFLQFQELIGRYGLGSDHPDFEAAYHEFVRKHWFGVQVTPDEFHWMMLGVPITIPTPDAFCCLDVQCTKVEASGNSVTEYFERQGGGNPKVVQQRLGQGWSCHCARRSQECYSAVERPDIDWPQIGDPPSGPDNMGMA